MTTAVLVVAGGAAATSRKVARSEVAVLAACASAAGCMAGGGNVAALPTLVLLGGSSPHPVLVIAWWCAVAMLGTLLAPLLVPRTVDDPELPYPTARAAVAVVESVEVREPTEAKGAPVKRVLAWATGIGGLAAVLRAIGALPATFAAPGAIGGRSLASLTFGLDASFVLAAAGALMNLRTGLSTLAGGLVTYAVIAPELLAKGEIAQASYRDIVAFMVWPAASLLVCAALLQLVLDTRRLLRRAALPPWRQMLAPAIACAVAIVIARVAFGVSMLVSLFAFPTALAIAFVAARAMGETDVVPTKALAPLAQLGFGAADTGMVATTMEPNLTSAAALHAADTLGSIRVGRALGASDRAVLRARLVGCVLGAVVVFVAYRVVVPDPSVLPTPELPAPAILVWRGVSEVVVKGVAGLSAETRAAILAGGLVGMALTVLERVVPKRYVAFVPSAAGLGSGMVLPASNALAIALGSVLKSALAKEGSPRASYVLPLASGLIAGESLVGIGVAAARALRALVV